MRWFKAARNLPPAFLLVLEAYLSLIRFDLCLARGNFEAIYNKVRDYTLGRRPLRLIQSNRSAKPWIWLASGIARKCCVSKGRPPRHAFSRKYGVSAHLVIGAQQMPFKAHAWVEVDGKVVNDKQYVPEIYGKYLDPMLVSSDLGVPIAGSKYECPVGRWNLDGKPVDCGYLERVGTTLGSYGPDGRSSFGDKNISILYHAFNTTKESRLEAQPHISASGAVITWDGRLDNRAELIRVAIS